MTEFNYIITDELGIHARPAGLLVKEADKFDSEITLSVNGNSGDAKRIFSVMSLGVKQGDEIKVSISGNDEETARQTLEKFFRANL